MGDHAQVTHGEDVPFQARHRTEYRNSGVLLDRFGNKQPLPLGRYLIEDDPADIQPFVELPAAEHQSGNRSRGFGAIHHQHDRQTEGERQIGRGIAPLRIHSVKEPPVAFDNDDFRIA
ncbi:MAG: hypothetical protein ACD_75C01066G0001 [uncultured bacterium]|nr:MAG: hypothetical protein ACD_75C01066G0001 [uncultured bacterium]